MIAGSMLARRQSEHLGHNFRFFSMLGEKIRASKPTLIPRAEQASRDLGLVRTYLPFSYSGSSKL